MALETRSVPRLRVHWFPRTSPQAGDRESVRLGSKTTLSLSGKVMLKGFSQMKYSGKWKTSYADTDSTRKGTY